MLIRLTKKLSMRISRPIWLEVESKSQLELKLEKSKPVNIKEAPEGYKLRIYTPNDKFQVVSLLNNAGIPFDANRLREVLSICLPKGCFIIEHIKTKTIVSMMMARHLSNDNHPFGGRIDWLATDPSHTGLGLGTISAGSATKRLQQAGYDDIWVTTDDHRIGALKIFHHIGFRPDVNQATLERWKKIYKSLGIDQIELEKYA